MTATAYENKTPNANDNEQHKDVVDHLCLLTAYFFKYKCAAEK